jgi:hypothetical protein
MGEQFSLLGWSFVVPDWRHMQPVRSVHAFLDCHTWLYSGVAVVMSVAVVMTNMWGLTDRGVC